MEKLLTNPRVHSSLVLAREIVKDKRDLYRDQEIYFEALNEVVEDLDKILFLIAEINLTKKEEGLLK